MRRRANVRATLRSCGACLAALGVVAACGSSDSVPASSGGGGQGPGTTSTTAGSGGSTSSTGGGGSTSSTGGGAGSSSGSGGSSSSGTTGSSSSGAGGGGDPLPYCQPACATPADCVIPGSPLYDAAHYECTAGVCVWQGCSSTAECQIAYPGLGYTCATAYGSAVPSCYPSCAVPANCAIAGSPLYDASHFACNGGVCEWQGCSSTADCEAQYPGLGYACDNLAGAGIDTCYPTCTAPADCAIAGGGALYDASHYACTGGLCEWTGCQSTAECQAAFPTLDYVCQ